MLRISGGTKLQNIGAVALMADGTIQDDLHHWGSDVPATTLLGLENDGADAVAQAYGALSTDIAKVIGKTTVELIVNDPNQTTADGLPIRVIRRTETNLGISARTHTGIREKRTSPSFTAGGSGGGETLSQGTSHTTIS